MARANMQGAAWLSDGWLQGQWVGERKKRGTELMGHLWCPVLLEREAGRRRIRAKRGGSQRDLCVDTLQTEHLVGLEGLRRLKGLYCEWGCVVLRCGSAIERDAQHSLLPGLDQISQVPKRGKSHKSQSRHHVSIVSVIKVRKTINSEQQINFPPLAFSQMRFKVNRNKICTFIFM